MTRERRSLAESKNYEILLLPTADRRFDTRGGHFGSNSPLYGAQRESNAWGLPGGGWAVLELTGTLPPNTNTFSD